MAVDTKTVESLTSKEAQEIVDSNVPIYLPSLKILTTEAAEVLAGANYPIILESLPALTVSAAKAIAGHKWVLRLQGVVNISRAVGDALAMHKGPLELGESLKSLSSPLLAKRIYEEKKGLIYLDNLQEISADVAGSFGKPRRRDTYIHRGVKTMVRGKKEFPHLRPHPNSFDEDGFDIRGYDRGGYDRDGYDQYGYDGGGYDRDGYDEGGFDEDGYDRNGRDIDGLDPTGFDTDGYDIEGYDREGYDREGYDSELYDRDGNYRANCYGTRENIDGEDELDGEEEEVDSEEDKIPITISLGSLRFLGADAAAELVERFDRIHLPGLSDGTCNLGDGAEAVLAAACGPDGGTDLVLLRDYNEYSHGTEANMACWFIEEVLKKIKYDGLLSAGVHGMLGTYYPNEEYYSENGEVEILSSLSWTTLTDRREKALRGYQHGWRILPALDLTGLPVSPELASKLLSMNLSSACDCALVAPDTLDDPNVLEMLLDAARFMSKTGFCYYTTPLLSFIESINADVASRLIEALSSPGTKKFWILGFDSLRDIEPAAAKVLSQSGYPLQLGLRTLSIDLAKAFALCETGICLPDLIDLLPEQVDILAKGKGLFFIPQELMPSPSPDNFSYESFAEWTDCLE